jgi:DNA-directed RNA polymerase specialized sigma24 family protein
LGVTTEGEREGEGSVSRWIVDLKAGDGAAARELWRRYFEELVRLARIKLGDAPRAEADEEDVALSAFHSLCAGATRGGFPNLDDRDGLWRLLVTITVRKAFDQVQRQRRQKRAGPSGAGSASLNAVGLDWVVGREPGPEVAAILAEEYRRLFDDLRDESLREVARLRLEGSTGSEIAERIGCNRRTVTRKLELIRQTWESEVPS